MKLTSRTLRDVRVADAKGRIALGSRYAGKRFALHQEADGTAVLTPVVVMPESERTAKPGALDESVEALAQLGGDWDGRGSPAPAPALVAHAREILALLHAGAAARGLPWVDPHVSANERGEITLEWWNGARTLTVFIRSAERVDYLKAWGSDIVSEMEDGELSRIADFASLSRWLYEDGTQAA